MKREETGSESNCTVQANVDKGGDFTKGKSFEKHKLVQIEWITGEHNGNDIFHKIVVNIIVLKAC